MTWATYPLFLLLALVIQWTQAQPGRDCPPLGPVFPPLHRPSENRLIQTIVKDIEYGLSVETAYEKTFVSISLTSIHEDVPLLDVHHTPPVRDKAGTSHVKSDTMYRIGSISKVFTVLTALLQNDKINWATPVTEYLPELKNVVQEQGDGGDNGFGVNWDQVTVEALATHLAGIGRECRQASILPMLFC